MKQLFTEFPPVSIEEWEQVIQKDLKGQDYNKKLVWKTDESFSVQPYYSESSLKFQIPNPPGMPSNWNAVEEISISQPKEALERFEKSLLAGAEAWKFVSIWNRNEIHGIDLASESEIIHFSKSIIKCINTHFENSKYPKPKTIKIFWDTSSTSPVYIKSWKQAFQDWSLVGCKLQVFFFQDPLSALTVCGEFPHSQERTWNFLQESLEHSFSQETGELKTISVNAINFANSGSNLTQELAYALSMGSEYLHQLTERGVSSDKIAENLLFRFCVGANYFHEIAKLRSFRFLWNQVLDAYSVPTDKRNCEILVETSTWNTTLFDPYVNMLRVTTEAMSAILGGANSLLVHPFNHGFQEEDDFAKRIAINVQHLLKYESYLDAVVDPSNGSYYIETLTARFSEDAWKLFQETETTGGYIKAFRSGTIQKQIATVSDAKKQAILSKKIPILGTSQYPNTTEKHLERSIPAPISKSRAPFPEYTGESDIKVDYLVTWRAAEEFEALRLSVEELKKSRGKKPVVQLFITGNRSMRTARASFVTNFFGVAGFEINNPGAKDDPKLDLTPFWEANPDILVFCSSDEEYLSLAAEYIPLLKEKLTSTQFFIAGNPPDQEKLKELGIQDFVHAKSHLYQTLKGLL